MGRHTKADRNAAIVEHVKHGISYQKIAAEFGITKERVHQIAHRDWDEIDGWDPSERELACLREEVAREAMNEVLGTSGTYGSADLVTTTVPDLLRLLADRLGGM